MHTETSGATNLQEAETRGIAVFGEVPGQVGRTLHLRLCIQGVFGDGTEGLEVQQRASDLDAWTQAGFVHGWDYSDSRSANDQITDENGQPLTIAADGGWVDFEIAIPDTATQVRLQPRYVAGTGSSYQHDLALRSFHWEWPEPEDSGTDHAVDAVPATWSFATPEPSVRRGRRRDAGAVTWMFELPEPTVKRTRRRDAEPAVWSFETSEPEVTFTRWARPHVPHVPTLLPPNATPLERALEAATRPRASEEVIRQVWDPWACPAKLLPWLAWAFSVDYWEEGWSEDQKRAVIAASIEVHQRKGTPAAMRNAVRPLGLELTLLEWWQQTPVPGVPGTAEAYVSRREGGVITLDDFLLASRLLEGAKRGTLHLTVHQTHVQRGQVAAVAWATAWAHPPALRFADA